MPNLNHLLGLYDSLLSYAYRLLRNADDAKDVVQQFYLSALAKGDEALGAVDNLNGYSTRAVANLCHRKIRDDMRHCTTHSELQQCMPVVNTSDPFGLEALLAPLSEYERRVVELHDIEGYRCREVAAMLGKSPAAIRKQLSLAHKKIRENEDRKVNSPFL